MHIVDERDTVVRHYVLDNRIPRPYEEVAKFPWGLRQLSVGRVCSRHPYFVPLDYPYAQRGSKTFNMRTGTPYWDWGRFGTTFKTYRIGFDLNNVYLVDNRRLFADKATSKYSVNHTLVFGDEKIIFPEPISAFFPMDDEIVVGSSKTIYILDRQLKFKKINTTNEIYAMFPISVNHIGVINKHRIRVFDISTGKIISKTPNNLTFQKRIQVVINPTADVVFIESSYNACYVFRMVSVKPKFKGNHYSDVTINFNQ